MNIVIALALRISARLSVGRGHPPRFLTYDSYVGYECENVCTAKHVHLYYMQRYFYPFEPDMPHRYLRGDRHSHNCASSA